MTTITKSEMLSECCGPDGKFDFEKMKAFMERCGKTAFSAEELDQMKQVCSDQAELCDRMMQLMKGCACTCE